MITVSNSFSKKSNFIDVIFDILICGIGCCLFATSINAFTVPNHIAPGGFTGIATITNYLFGFPIGLVLFILNIPIMIVAWKILGLKFIIKTMLVTTALSILIDVFATFMPVYNNDRLLASLFGGVLAGVGMALIFIRGATSGGTDILAKLLRLKWPHISMGQIILITDMLVVIISSIIYRSIESALYAFIVIFVSSKVIDYVLYGTGHGKMLLVFSNHAKEISETITSELHRGVSIVDAKGGYTGEQKYMLICAVRSNEVAKLTKIVKYYDEHPFILVSEVNEILGQGFKLDET
ncbi:MAG: YitT family protein [Clostridia bacterium]|nr:YitT family protein [Clostridia bacterium]